MKTDKYLYVVRHGEAEGNIDPNKRGPNSSLTEEGKKQAEVVAERFKKIPVDVIVSSPMKRAHDTSLVISDAIKFS